MGQEVGARWKDSKGFVGRMAELGKGCAQHLSACMGSPSGPSMMPQEVSQPAGSPILSGTSSPFWSPQLAVCVHISEMMTSGGLLSVLSIANLAMGQDLCLAELCVPTGLRTWQGQRGRSEAATPCPGRRSWPPLHSAALCPSLLFTAFLPLCQLRLMNMYNLEIRNLGEKKEKKRERKKQIVMEIIRSSK